MVGDTCLSNTGLVGIAAEARMALIHGPCVPDPLVQQDLLEPQRSWFTDEPRQGPGRPGRLPELLSGRAGIHMQVVWLQRVPAEPFN